MDKSTLIIILLQNKVSDLELKVIFLRMCGNTSYYSVHKIKRLAWREEKQVVIVS